MYFNKIRNYYLGKYRKKLNISHYTMNKFKKINGLIV